MGRSLGPEHYFTSPRGVVYLKDLLVLLPPHLKQEANQLAFARLDEAIDTDYKELSFLEKLKTTKYRTSNPPSYNQKLECIRAIKSEEYIGDKMDEIFDQAAIEVGRKHGLHFNEQNRSFEKGLSVRESSQAIGGLSPNKQSQSTDLLIQSDEWLIDESIREINPEILEMKQRFAQSDAARSAQAIDYNGQDYERDARER